MQAFLCVLCSIALVGCSTRVSVVREDLRAAKLKVTSAPAGANVYVNRKSVGLTPTRVEVPYSEVERHYEPGTRRSGWLLLVTGALGFVGGLAMMVAGAKALGDENDKEFDQTDAGALALGASGIAFGIPLFGAGGVGLIAGMYNLFTGRKPFNEVHTTPRQLRIGLNVPGYGMREARLLPVSKQPKPTHFDQLSALHYDANTDRWSAPGLPAALRLSASYPGKRRQARQTVTTRLTAPRTSEVSGLPRVAVFEVENQGGRLPTRVVAQLSDYLNTRLAARRDWRIVKRQRLNQQLRAHRRRTRQPCGTQSCQAAVARSLDASKTLATMVAELGGRCSVTGVVFDVKQDATAGTASARGGCSEDELVRSVESVVEQLTRHAAAR